MLDVTICGLCGKEQRYRNTPTNLTQNLSREHSLEFGGTLQSAPELENFFHAKSNTPKYRPDHPKQKVVRSKLIEWIIKNNRPLGIVKDEKLVESFELADDEIKVPVLHAI